MEDAFGQNNVPGLPSSLFAFIVKGWHNITTCEGMKEQHAFGLFRSNIAAQVMHTNPS